MGENMSSNVIYYTVCLIGYLIAGSIFLKSIRNAKKMRIRKKPLELVKDFMIKDLDVNHVNQMIKKTGIKTSLLQYQIGRYVICFGIILLTVTSSISQGERLSTGFIIFWVLAFFASAPDLKFFKFKSPFEHLIDFLIISKQQKNNIELYRSVSQLKNLAITKANRPPGAEFILEQLKKFTKTTRPVFNQMQSLWSMGEKDKACDYFAAEIGTPEAESFSSIIRKIDSMNPIELRQQMVLFQEVVRRKRETERIKQNLLKSYLIYVVVVTGFMSLFINFLVIGVFIDMLEGFRKM